MEDSIFNNTGEIFKKADSKMIAGLIKARDKKFQQICDQLKKDGYWGIDTEEYFRQYGKVDPIDLKTINRGKEEIKKNQLENILQIRLLLENKIEEIVAEGATYRPELVVITDGDDSISLTVKDFQGTKVHAFMVECSNKVLTDLAVKTGGVGVNKL